MLLETAAGAVLSAGCPRGGHRTWDGVGCVCGAVPTGTPSQAALCDAVGSLRHPCTQQLLSWEGSGGAWLQILSQLRSLNRMLRLVS